MLASSLLVLASAVASAVAQTTTSTSTLTETITLTQCNPTNTACPAYSAKPLTTTSSTLPSSYPVVSSTSSAWSYPTFNTTSTHGPTASSVYVYHNTSSYSAASATYSVATVTTPKATTATTKASSTTTSAATVPTGGALALSLKSGVLMGALGAAVAMLA